MRVCLDFMVFTGFEQEVPDATTICRFRKLLTQKQLWEKILRSINESLEDKDLKVRASQGAILDAAIIESAARPQKGMNALVEDRFEEEGEETINVKVLSEAHHSVDSNQDGSRKASEAFLVIRALPLSMAIRDTLLIFVSSQPMPLKLGLWKR